MSGAEESEWDNDDEDEEEYEIRQSRRETSYEYRASSSLTGAQFSEQETYYDNAEEVL